MKTNLSKAISKSFFKRFHAGNEFGSRTRIYQDLLVHVRSSLPLWSRSKSWVITVWTKAVKFSLFKSFQYICKNDFDWVVIDCNSPSLDHFSRKVTSNLELLFLWLNNIIMSIYCNLIDFIDDNLLKAKIIMRSFQPNWFLQKSNTFSLSVQNTLLLCFLDFQLVIPLLTLKDSPEIKASSSWQQ